MYSQEGVLEWIGIRPGKRLTPKAIEAAELVKDKGILGDHHNRAGKRQVTLIQAEHLDALFTSLNKTPDPALIRRNLVIRGIDLQTLKNRNFKIGECILQGTGECLPCERMNENLGDGGLDAMAGKGGITARIIKSGQISLGSEVSYID
jgi:MOSC domain-containing protein YiiM